MGHLRLGRLPKTYNWQAVVDLLNDSPADAPAVARATIKAAETRLRELARDPSLTYCFWLLTRIAWSSREPDFNRALAELGLQPTDNGLALSFISQVSDHVRSELARYPESGPFSELASLALRRALSETVEQEGQHIIAEHQP